jgi:hypothetical protein
MCDAGRRVGADDGPPSPRSALTCAGGSFTVQCATPRVDELGTSRCDVLVTDESKIRDAGDAARGILEATPIYQDALQPAARQVGRALETVGKAVNVALAPVAALVWGYEKIRDWLVPALEARLGGIPPDRIVTPRPTLAGPVIEALRFAGHEETLRDLYANLLATAMDAETAHTAHPAFVEILRQLTPDEAKLIGHLAGAPAVQLAFIKLTSQIAPAEGEATYEGGWEILARFSTLGQEAGCAFEGLTTSYLDNFDRLGILECTDMAWWSGDEAEAVYAKLEQHPRVRALWAQIEGTNGRRPVIDRGLIRMTTFGRQFIAACVVDRSVGLSQVG